MRALAPRTGRINGSPDERRALRARRQADRAMRMVHRGLHGRAELCLRRAIGLQPDNPQWHLELARLLARRSPVLARLPYETASRLGSANAQLEAAALHPDPGAIEYLPPHALWRPERLDIAAKLGFAKYHLHRGLGRDPAALRLYRRHILQRTGGREPESLGKPSVASYEASFASLLDSMRTHGFSEQFAIPVDADGGILNGAHRLAAALALALGLDRVPVVRMPAPWKALDWGMAWFLHQGFAPADIHSLLRTWREFHPGTAHFLLVGHSKAGIPAGWMDDLRHRFPIVAWRALGCAGMGMFDVPTRPWHGLRYVLLEADDLALDAFSTQQNARHGPRIHCHPVPAPDTDRIADILLDESSIEALHSPTIEPSAVGEPAMWAWLRYARDPDIRPVSHEHGDALAVARTRREPEVAA